MRLPRILLTAAVVAAALSALPPTAAYAADETIVATSANKFSPSVVTIRRGDTVTWERASSNGPTQNHTVTSASDNWDFDEQLSLTQPDAAYEFTDYGSYKFVCSVHGDAMSGTVRVPAPKPTVKPSTRPPTSSPSPSSSSPRPTATATTDEPEPSESTSAPPLVAPTPTTAPSRSSAPTPSVAPELTETSPDTVTIGGPGLTPPPATGRERGVWVMLACVAILGVGSAQLRTLLGVPLDDEL